MTTPKLTLNLNEENELAFRVSIEGTSSDIGSTKPKYRFVVTEGNSEGGTLFPAVQDEDGSVVVNISGNELFTEEADYKGKLEVILGNHYFVPTEVDIEFIKPLKVEAAVVRRGSSSLREEKGRANINNGDNEMKVSSAGVQVRSNKKVKETTKPAERPAKLKPATKKAKKQKWDNLSESDKKKILEFHKKKKLKELKEQAAVKKEKEKQLKNTIKNLMSNSLLDDD